MKTITSKRINVIAIIAAIIMMAAVIMLSLNVPEYGSFKSLIPVFMGAIAIILMSIGISELTEK